VSGGVLLAGLGVWVLCQVFGGNALGRLRIIGGGEDTPATSSAPAAVSTPAAGAGPRPAVPA